MSVLEFIAAIVDSVAGPIALAVIARWAVKVYKDSFEEGDEEWDVMLLTICRDTILRLTKSSEREDEKALRVVDQVTQRLDRTDG